MRDKDIKGLEHLLPMNLPLTCINNARYTQEELKKVLKILNSVKSLLLELNIPRDKKSIEKITYIITETKELYNQQVGKEWDFEKEVKEREEEHKKEPWRTYMAMRLASKDPAEKERLLKLIEKY